MGQIFADVYLYFTSTFGWWLVIGMSADGLLALANRLTGLDVPRRAFVVFAMVAIFLAGFLAWREEHRVRLAAEAASQAGAGAELRQLEGKIARLERKTKARRLNDEEKKGLVAQIGAPPAGVDCRVVVSCVNTDPDDACVYAADIDEVLVMSHWKGQKHVDQAVEMGGYVMPSGATIRYGGPAAATALQLKAALNPREEVAMKPNPGEACILDVKVGRRRWD